MRGPMRGMGVARAVLVAAAGAGMVLGAGQVSASWQLDDTTTPPAARGGGPEAAQEPAVQAVERSLISCAGPEQQGVRASDDGEVDQSVRVLAATPPASALPQDVRPEGRGELVLTPQPAGGTEPISTDEAADRVGVSIDEGRSVAVSGLGAMAPGIAAMQFHLSTTEQRRALMTAACGAPTAESWLLAGAAEPGRQERLVLVNPGANPVTADVEILGSEGPVDTPGGRGVVVPAEGRTVLLLDAMAGAEQVPVVHVTAHGGELFTALGDSWLEGILDRGGELTTASAPPAREQVVPTVPVAGSASLRLAVPGEVEAVAQVRALTAEGPRGVDNDVVRIPGRTTVDIDVADLPEGTHALQVRADEPVVAAAAVERRAEPDGVADLAWSPARPPLDALGGTPLVTLEESELTNRLTLAAPGEPSTVTVTTVDADGGTTEERVDVPADSVVTHELGSATSVWARPEGGQVRAAVVSTVQDEAGEMIAVMPVQELVLTRAETVLRPHRS